MMIPLIYGVCLNLAHNGPHIGCCHSVLSVTFGCMYLGGILFLGSLVVTYPLSLFDLDDLTHVSRIFFALATGMPVHRTFQKYQDYQWEKRLASIDLDSFEIEWNDGLQGAD